MARTLLTSILLMAAGAASAQNTCATALPVAAGTHSIAAVNGSQIPIPICANTGTGAVNGEWYTYTPTANYGVTISTDLPQNIGDDTRLHVYTGFCGALTCLAGNDDIGAGNNRSLVTFNAQQGVTYIFAFDNIWSSAGFDFMLSEGPIVVQPVSFTLQVFSPGFDNRCVTDMNNDQLDDIIVPGYSTVTLHHQQPGGGFVTNYIGIPTVANGPDWSVAIGDYDKNGQNDLVYGGGGGVSFLKANANGTAFTEVAFPQYVFSQRTNFVDMNSDGHLDAFVCHDIDPNVYYINDGLGNFTFYQGGLGDTPQGGNYGSIWIDYDNDHDVDLFIAKCGADAVDQLHRNDGGNTFASVAPAMNLSDNGQSWSSAWGDYDNDGDMDVMSGDGSGGGHRLMRNDGSIFTDVSTGSGFDLIPGSGLEYTTHDFNNDGWLDVLMDGGLVMLNNADMTFEAVGANADDGGVGDLNNDGYLDVHGAQGIHMNNGGPNHYLRVNTVGTTSNGNGIGARVTCTSALGTQIRDVRSGDAFSSMSSLMTHFGLGSDTQVNELTIHWPSGIVNTWTNLPVDTVLTLVEDPLTTVGEAVAEIALSVWPVPATDNLFINGMEPGSVRNLRVLDATGRAVMSQRHTSNVLNVAPLRPGIYTLEVSTDSGSSVVRFTKR